MAPEIWDGLRIIGVVAAAVCVLTPLLYWSILAESAKTP